MRRGPQRVAIAVGADRDVTLILDLAFADARAVVSQIGAAALDLVWVRAEDASPVRRDLVSLAPETAERMRTMVARLEEWHSLTDRRFRTPSRPFA